MKGKIKNSKEKEREEVHANCCVDVKFGAASTAWKSFCPIFIKKKKNDNFKLLFLFTQFNIIDFFHFCSNVQPVYPLNMQVNQSVSDATLQESCPWSNKHHEYESEYSMLYKQFNESNKIVLWHSISFQMHVYTFQNKRRKTTQMVPQNDRFTNIYHLIQQ